MLTLQTELLHVRLNVGKEINVNNKLKFIRT